MIGKKSFKYFLLEDGDKVKANDEWYNPKLDKWEYVNDGDMDDGYYPDAIIGYEYDHSEHKPIRRKNSDKTTVLTPSALGVLSIDVINSDIFEGETVEKDCEIVEILGKKVMTVKLSSDPSIKCLVKLINKRWEIIENIE